MLFKTKVGTIDECHASMATTLTAEQQKAKNPALQIRSNTLHPDLDGEKKPTGKYSAEFDIG